MIYSITFEYPKPRIIIQNVVIIPLPLRLIMGCVIMWRKPKDWSITNVVPSMVSLVSNHDVTPIFIGKNNTNKKTAKLFISSMINYSSLLSRLLSRHGGRPERFLKATKIRVSLKKFPGPQDIKLEISSIANVKTQNSGCLALDNLGSWNHPLRRSGPGVSFHPKT